MNRLQVPKVEPTGDGLTVQFLGALGRLFVLEDLKRVGVAKPRLVL